MPRFTFRPLELADLARLTRWFNAPHVARWFGARTLAEVEDEYGGYLRGAEPVVPYVIVHDDRDVGMICWERLGEFPEIAALYSVSDPDATNCDVLIGEPDLLHRGLGPTLIRAFLEQVVFNDPRSTCSIIDPHTDNAVAIRAYEKAGYRFLHVAPDDGDGKAVYLMELRRDDLSKPLPNVPYLRPARPDELALARAIDDDAVGAYAALGIPLLLPHDHPFARYEEARWAASLAEGNLLFACTPDGTPQGFAAFGLVDGHPFLHQISVRTGAARQGLGTLLLERIKRWAVGASRPDPAELWLTTYDHVAFNRPWYQRIGFEVVDEADAGPELRAIAEKERDALPDPERRVLMRWR